MTTASAASTTPMFTSSGFLSQAPEDGNGSGLRNVVNLNELMWPLARDFTDCTTSWITHD